MSWETSRQIIPIPKATTAMTTLNWLWWLQTWIVIYSFMASSITFVNILTRFWLPSFWRKYSRKCTTIFLKTENNHLACLISIFFPGHWQFPHKFLWIFHSILSTSFFPKFNILCTSQMTTALLNKYALILYMAKARTMLSTMLCVTVAVRANTSTPCMSKSQICLRFP